MGGAHLQLTEVNCESMPDGPANPCGVGICATETILGTELAAQRNGDPSKSRVWKIKNPKVLNPLNGQPVAWKLMPHPSPPLYANPSSTHFRRGYFATKHLFATPYSELEKYPAGIYPLEPDSQTIRQWTAANRSLDGADLVLWHTIGVTHIPRCEDWPCMPVEHASFFLKPVNFFDVNPGISLPPAHNKASVSVRGSSCCGTASNQSSSQAVARSKESRTVGSSNCSTRPQQCCASSYGCRCGTECTCDVACTCKAPVQARL